MLLFPCFPQRGGLSYESGNPKSLSARIERTGNRLRRRLSGMSLGLGARFIRRRPKRGKLPPSRSLSDRVIDYLAEAEADEPDLHLRDDIQQALRTVVLAREGSPMPFIEASYALWGMHPAKVWPRILAHRLAMLGDPVNFQAFKFARKMRNQEAPRGNVESASSLSGPKTSTENLYAMPLPPRPAKQEPVPVVPKKSAR